jgi:anion-transporting  ArsA/GET3 family ATPase
MRTTKLSDFLKQQGLTPDGNKTVYQAFIDNWGPRQPDVWVKNVGSEITAAFVWTDTQEGVYFWRKIDEKWINNMGKSENDMLWLLESKESPEETEINSYFNLEITKEHEKNMMKGQDGIDMISEVFKIEINIETNSGYTKNEYLRQKIDKFLAEIKQLKDY